MKFWLRFILVGLLCLMVGCVSTMEAQRKLDAGRYDDAIPLYKEYLQENQYDTDARSRLGFAYLKTGQIDRAINELKTVLAQKPGEPYAVYYLGLAYVNNEEFQEAINTWKEYRNSEQPLVEDEIQRQMTLLQIAESQRYAKKALSQEEKLLARTPPSNTIAVFYYKDLSPGKEMAAFQKGLAAMVISDLSKIKSLQVVERMRLQALLAEMNLGQSGVVDTRTAPRVGRLLGARNIVVGSLMRGSIKAVSTINGQSSSVTVSEGDFWKIPQFVVRTVVDALNIRLTPQEEAAVGIAHTKVYNAFIYYGEALMAQDAGRWEEAKDLFAKALAVDPNFDMARGGESDCPSASAPSVSALSSMSATAIASSVSAAVSAAEEAQAEASSQSSSMSSSPSSSSGSSGGDGGGDGGG